ARATRRRAGLLAAGTPPSRSPGCGRKEAPGGARTACRAASRQRRRGNQGTVLRGSSAEARAGARFRGAGEGGQRLRFRLRARAAQKLCGHAQRRAVTGERMDPMDLTEKRTVLVVDDSPQSLQILTELLQQHYRVRLASNGEQALKAALQEPTPD